MRTSTHRDEDYVLLAHDGFRFVSDWWYFAILSLAETDDFDAAPWAIARRLGISREQDQEATETLLRLGILQKSPHGVTRPSGKQFRTTFDISDTYIKKHHAQGLEPPRLTKPGKR